MDILNSEFDLPIKYMQSVDGRICATVNRNWLKNLKNVGKIIFITHDRLSADEIAAQPSLEELGSNWTRIYIKVYEKQFSNAIPLPRDKHSTNIKIQSDLTFSQLLRYVSETNYRNLWKESYKKYYSIWNLHESKEQTLLTPSSNDVAVMHEVLSRLYGCPLIHVKNNQVISVTPGVNNNYNLHCNLLPVMFAVETTSAFMIFHEQTAKFSLHECVMYSPATLSTSYNKPLFLVYQLLHLSRYLHDSGLALGEITLSDILLMDNYTIQVLPKLDDNIYLKPDVQTRALIEENKPINYTAIKLSSNSLKMDGTKAPPSFGLNENIESLCEMWIYGQISNYDYLTALNNLAGRRFGDPSCHHVMPWVTDFSSRSGKNWRDLTKSKFRLNKGDRQLDLTFDSQTTEVGHHVSDVLSEITYYVYLSRRYTRSVLCKHVRSHWVPWEYPASIQRLQEWSPDECIPQFFTDPNVFKSIHEDLPDLELPSWARSPEDFIEKHREALESFYVSERLHHWIDLTFGYKLSGLPAIKSKNVCLQLVDNHTNLTNSGVVQLFTHPHPQKIVPSPYWSKTAPRLRNLTPKKSKTEKSADKVSDDEGHSSGFEEVESPVTTLNVTRSSPLALSRLLSRSRGSLLAADENSRSEKSTSQTIQLPKDYNPVAALNQVESVHSFISKVSHRIYQPEMSNQTGLASYRQIVACARIKEQQIIGCLIVEIFMPNKFRATWNTSRISFSRRLETCVNVLNKFPDLLPKCVRNAVCLLLQVNIIPKSYGINSECDLTGDINNFRYPTVTHMGLPPPSAHQFLQPILSSSLLPSRYFQQLFHVVQMLQEYNNLVRELNSVIREDDAEASNTRVQFLCKINECKVKALARELERLLLSYTGNLNDFNSILRLIVPHIKQIMDEPYSAVLAAWYLFDPIGKALGPKDTAETFLAPIVKLYENGSIIDSNIYADYLPVATLAKFRIMKLYHRSFLLKLMVRLGLRRFLENFITPLVEAVGCYRDHPQTSSINQQRAGNLKSCDLSDNSGEGEVILSPLDEDSSVDSEQNLNSVTLACDPESSRETPTIENEVEEVFTMETEEILSPSDNKVLRDPHMVLNLNIIDDLVDEGVRNSPPGTIKSPTIPIPTTTDRGIKLVADFNTIGCHVGSKTSSEDLPLSSSYTGNIQTSTAGETSAYDSDKAKTAFKIDIGATCDDELDESKDKNFESEALTPRECKVSEISTESVIWLSHRLGPVLTARYLSRNLLRMLTLCYAGSNNLVAIDEDLYSEELHWRKVQLVGDINAMKVLESLTAIASLYGEQMIILQYLSHMAELLTLCKRKLTPNLEGGLVSCLALLSFVTPCLGDASLMDALHETIVKSILHPTVRILSTTRYSFPSGVNARTALANKCLEVLSSLSIRLGSATTKTHLSVPIQRFFLAFDKVFNAKGQSQDEEIPKKRDKFEGKKINDRNEFLKDSTHDWTLVDSSSMGIQAAAADIAVSYSPPILDHDETNPQRNQAFEELKSVFTLEFAHKAYLLFYRHLDEGMMEDLLKNHQLIRELCEQYEQNLPTCDIGSSKSDPTYLQTAETPSESDVIVKGIGSFGNISVVGNRIEVGDTLDNLNPSNRDGPVSHGRQLRGNWLAYWEHEIGRPDKDLSFNIKQIKLQSFSGHTNSVRCLHVLDNENSFMSGARDKTVKLWSIRSQGDGTGVSPCQYTYTGHKKSILALTFLESLRYAVTCDGAVHCWDPFMGSLLGCPESSRAAPVNALAANNTPSTSLLAATTDVTLHVIDCRTFSYVNELKVAINPAGLIRCIAVAPSGHWVALGQASGVLTILDIRTGLIIASWKGHECEILQLEAVNETTIVSSSLDQTIAVWSAVDGKLKFHLKGATEPVHCMALYEQQLISGTTANRIGVHAAVDNTAVFSSSKLKSDAFKGVLTAMTVLPLNRLLLLGSDNGGITLLC
ncbi:WD repeat-containing protein 81 isoform X1 [Microplitis demolitor]|uniref:WD repeat-containing protein 81 isoform X1 n=1 Tax=Microplitis demolitor TaxID=69319 RepID=UPI0004CCF431|nr:WD repeat-containing protein 81 isoform X1 [Microplitis demolitor]XP_008544194.1 WD repeat-containing protein 81 isoform X1 [Microplitis demolitor]XP_008544195.1 WD repeat-containing protein 81 isoform X1 [Microplitis demolitor]XP_008544196.1 WD repeat-containing protein 81 isoform X1 [Microplitis demolitor]XP_008544197.1 WD repeat-containing protein 81 isoform X1 [Microplitis demolitor]XP_008544198.1 WD repeat-containing protein 81 isoform X1 [Microplitis demolitor]XP_053593211.1 WD repea